METEVASVAPPRVYKIPEFKGIKLRETSYNLPDVLMDNPAAIAEFLRKEPLESVRFTDGVENFIVLMLNTRRRLIGWQVVSTGTLDTILIHPREVFRMAVLQGAAAIVIAHNHPSMIHSPSEADIKVTRDLIRAGTVLKIEVLDHVIMGGVTPEQPKDYCSLRELGYFYAS